MKKNYVESKKNTINLKEKKNVCEIHRSFKCQLFCKKLNKHFLYLLFVFQHFHR